MLQINFKTIILKEELFVFYLIGSQLVVAILSNVTYPR